MSMWRANQCNPASLSKLEKLTQGQNSPSRAQRFPLGICYDTSGDRVDVRHSDLSAYCSQWPHILIDQSNHVVALPPLLLWYCSFKLVLRSKRVEVQPAHCSEHRRSSYSEDSLRIAGINRWIIIPVFTSRPAYQRCD
jgi:hypothetical protein